MHATVQGMSGAQRLVLSALALALLGPLGCGGSPQPAAKTQEAARERTFEFRYEVVVPEVPPSAREAFLWIPYPPETEDQTIHDLEILGALPYEIVSEPKYGNRALRFVLTSGHAGETVGLRVIVTRRERVRRPREGAPGLGTAQEPNLAAWLQPDRRVPLDATIRQWAEETVAGRTTALAKARAIYNYAVSNLRYDKTGTGWGEGDIYWACDAKRGNCTDFHSLFIGFARSVDIPARFEMGFPIPVERGAGEVAGYHCWAQFWLDGWGWIPLDASEANRHPDKREYFFGAHDENRILFSLGRDLKFPGMQGEQPLNFFIYPYAEVDGTRVEGLERRFTYRDLEPTTA